MALEEGNLYKLKLDKLVEKYDTGTEIYSRMQIVEEAVRDCRGRIVDGEKTYILVTCDEQEQFVECDGATVEVTALNSDYGTVDLRDVYDDSIEFTMDQDDAEMALEAE